jgi:DNA polymerase (family 10)
VALEVNGALERLDASAEVVRRAVRRGVKLVIVTDSHHISELGRMEHGVSTAQRGWARRTDVLNTLPVEEFLAAARVRRG